MSIGFTLPFVASTGSVGLFNMTEDEYSALEQDIRSLLVTNWGERVMMYNFGCNFREFLFEQKNSEELKMRIADRINSQLSTWMPFVVIDELIILFTEDDSAVPENGVGVAMKYRLTSKPDLQGKSSFIVTS